MTHVLAPLTVAAALAFAGAASAQGHSGTYHPGAPQLAGGASSHHEQYAGHRSEYRFVRERRHDGAEYRGYHLPPDYVTRNTAEPFYYHVPEGYGREGWRGTGELDGGPGWQEAERGHGHRYGHDAPRAEDGYIYHPDGSRTPVDGRAHADGYGHGHYSHHGHRDVRREPIPYPERMDPPRGGPGFREGSDGPGHYWSESHERLPHGHRYSYHESYGETSGWSERAGYRGHAGWPIVLPPHFLYGSYGGVGYGAGETTVAYSRSVSHFRSADPRMRLPSARMEAHRRGIRP
ncbi:hypothetical protein FKB34_10860 [Glycocaulis profundi]|nr:hypothetical protein FKB34_10860 [Glycocaulis profundi]